MQPGQTISPGDNPDDANWQYNNEADPAPPQPPAQKSADQPTDQSNAPDPASQSEIQTIIDPQPKVQAGPTNATDNSVSWTASEFIAHQKSANWYLILALITIALAAGVYFVTKDKISTAVIVVIGIIFGIAAARKPRELPYKVDTRSLQIGEKTYPFNSFKSFSIVQEDGVESIWFMPSKRFLPIISIYFDTKIGDKIVDILNKTLPMENRQPDAVDRLMHRIHF